LGVWQRAGSEFAEQLAEHGRAAPGSWNALQAMFDAVRSNLVGNRVAIGSDENRFAFTLRSLEASVGPLAAASGQVDDVSLRAEDFTWRSFQCARVLARLGNFHTRLRSRPILVSAPIDVTAVLTGPALNAVFVKYVPHFRCEITPTGDLRIHRANRPRWGYVQVVPAVEHGAIVLRPSGVGRGVHLWRFRRRLLPIRPRLNLPDWVRVTGADLHPGSLEVRLRIDEWTVDSQELMSLVRNHRRAGGGGHRPT